MRLGLAAALLLASAGAAHAVSAGITPAAQSLFTGAPATVTLHAPRVPGTGQGLTMTLPAIPTLKLTTVRDPASGRSLDCSLGVGGTLGLYTIGCAANGLQVQAADTADPVALDVTFATNQAGAPNVPLTVNCTSDCGAGIAASATLAVTDYPLQLTHAPAAMNVPAGGVAVFNVQLMNGPLAASQIDLSEAIPPGTSLQSVTLGGQEVTPGATWTAAGAGNGEAQLNGTLLEVRPSGGQLVAGTQFAYQVKLKLATPKPGDSVTATVTSAASAPPARVDPQSKSATITVVTGGGPTYSLAKTVDRQHVHLGDRVVFTVSARPSGGPLPEGAQLSDALDGALSLAELKVAIAGAPPVTASCTGAPQPLGPLQVTCPPPGRGSAAPVVAVVAPGQSIPGELRLVLSCDVRPTASPSGIDNTARLGDAIGGALAPDAAVHLILDGVAAAGANLILRADRAVATRGDLVPLSAQIGASQALAAPLLALDLGRALRPVGTVEITRDDGAPAAQVAPTESGGALQLPLGAIPAGTVVTAHWRARVGVRATPGPYTITGALSDGATLASASTSLRVEAEPDFDLATLVGTVYRDENGDGKRSPGEAGIEGATLVMDDGITAVTDGDGRYHIAAVVPGQRVVKLAAHTLAPGARLTSDGTRVIAVTPGILTVVDFGVAIPPPSLPAARPRAPIDGSPALHPAGPEGLRYRLAGAAPAGARVFIDGRAAKVDARGAWTAELTIRPGRTRLAEITAHPDGRVVFAARDVYWVQRAEGGSVVYARPEEPRLILRFPAAALADPRFTLEGTALESAPRVVRLVVAGAALAPDRAGRLRATLRLPDEAAAGVPIEVEFADGLTLRYSHVTETGGDFALLVGIAEAKLSYVVASGAAAPGPGHGTALGDSGLYAQGRVALYAKGRIQGRYLLEGGLDVDTAQLSDWRDLFRGDPTRVFRSLDPDRFYTVYGDASQTVQSAPTRGALFVRIAVDRSQLQLGNIQTGMTGVELGRYARSLTGGRIDLVLAGKTPDGPPSTQVIVFGAWLQTARAHDELRGTGGSLYYLSHRTLVEGSAQVRVELRDALSDRPIGNQALRPLTDYEIDPLAGRVALREPLASLAAGQSLVRSGPLDGTRAFLIADYEYVVSGDADDGAVGLRATQRLGRVRLGASFASELRQGYLLFGGDAQLDLGRFGVVVGEFAHSEGRQLAFARSDDGGLTYADALAPPPGMGQVQQGNAWKAEADLHGWGLALRPYVRAIDRGFTDSAHAQDQGLLQFGAEGSADLLGAHLRLHYDERHLDLGQPPGDPAPLRRDLGGDLGRRFGRFELKLGARAELVSDPDPSRAGHRTTLAARASVDVTRRLTLYALGQYTVEHGGGGGPTGRDASLGALGATVRLPWDFTATGEGSYGAQGPGGLVGVKRDLGAGRLLYGSYTISQDRDDVVSTAIAVGGRQRLGESRATLFAEDQFRDGRDVPLTGELKRSHLQSVGADLPLARRLDLGASFEHGEVSGAADTLSRSAGSLHASYAGERLRLQLKGELRQDQHPATASAPSLTLLQWLASGTATIALHRDLTLRGKALLSQTSDAAGTHTIELSAGFAWRPSFVDGAALLGRYAYLDDQAPAVQAAGAGPAFSERAHAASLAGEARLFWRISLGEKLAFKRRTEDGGLPPLWMILLVSRLSLHVTSRIDAVVEHRWLTQVNIATQQGVALEANYLLGGHLRIGAGYNFSDVSDEELQLGRGHEHGVFVRAQGYY